MADITIVDYSDKAIAIAMERDCAFDWEFNELGGRFNSRLKFGSGWIFSKKKSEERLRGMFGYYGLSVASVDLVDVATNASVDAGDKSGTHSTSKNRKNKTDKPVYILTDKERRDWARDVMGDEDYYYKQYAVIVRLEGGQLVPIKKNRIKTEFWFGESDCGQGLTSEEAHDRANTASTDERYFIKENTSDYKDMIARLDGTYGGSYKYLWLANWHRDKQNDWDLDKSSVCSEATNAIECLDWKESKMYEEGAYIKLSETDKARLLAGYKLALEMMEKRLGAYLKRYGMSKVSGRVYWADR